jgi:hypothetical protein
MKKIALSSSAWPLLAGLPLASAQTPEGRTYTPGNFDAVEISGSADVRFTQGPSDQVFVRGDEEVQRAVLLDVRNGRLRIDQGGAWRFWDANRVRVEVQARDLSRVTISGAGDFVAPAPVRVERLVVSISGAGSARFERLDARALSFQIAGKGDGQVAARPRNCRSRSRATENSAARPALGAVRGAGERNRQRQGLVGRAAAAVGGRSRQDRLLGHAAGAAADFGSGDDQRARCQGEPR